jgi:putative oxidoreductase
MRAPARPRTSLTTGCFAARFARPLSPEGATMNSQTLTVFTIGRVLMSILFLVAGIRKAMAYAGTVSSFTALGLPLPEVVAPIVIAIEIGGGLALLIGWQTKIVALVLAVFTLATALVAHRFWSVEGPQFSGQLNNFLKNVAMVGGFMVLWAAERVRTGAVSRAPSVR